MVDKFWARPVFFVRDVEASLAYYCNQLGFEKQWAHGSGKLIVAAVGRGGIDIILDSASVLPRAAGRSIVSMTLHKADTLEELHVELRDRGAKITSPPFAVIWQEGTYQFDVEDPDGNVLVFWGEKSAVG